MHSRPITTASNEPCRLKQTQHRSSPPLWWTVLNPSALDRPTWRAGKQSARLAHAPLLVVSQVYLPRTLPHLHTLEIIETEEIEIEEWGSFALLVSTPRLTSLDFPAPFLERNLYKLPLQQLSRLGLRPATWSDTTSTLTLLPLLSAAIEFRLDLYLWNPNPKDWVDLEPDLKLPCAQSSKNALLLTIGHAVYEAKLNHQLQTISQLTDGKQRNRAPALRVLVKPPQLLINRGLVHWPHITKRHRQVGHSLRQACLPPRRDHIDEDGGLRGRRAYEQRLQLRQELPTPDARPDRGGEVVCGYGHEGEQGEVRQVQEQVLDSVGGDRDAHAQP
ncbi:hypothetical protein K438DRAFT_545587 [Mycena galopus ATCC 62051]|nr:hypothetical protein K438DRAFT_545587 [Mycena galopus ATCC 62051]